MYIHVVSSVNFEFNLASTKVMTFCQITAKCKDVYFYENLDKVTVLFLTKSLFLLHFRSYPFDQ